MKEEDLKWIKDNDDRELLSFVLTAGNIMNKLTAMMRAKLNSSMSSLFCKFVCTLRYKQVQITTSNRSFFMATTTFYLRTKIYLGTVPSVETKYG